MTITETGDASTYEYGAICNRKILLYSLSKSYYLYLTPLLNRDENMLMQNLPNYGLAEPMRVFSNVTGGTGILGAGQTDTVTVNLREILPDFWE